MKKIINTTNRVICMAGKNVMPGDAIDVSDKAAQSKSIEAVIKINKLTATDIPEATETATETTTKKRVKKAADAATETAEE